MKKNKIINHLNQNKFIYLFVLLICLIYLTRLTYFPIFADEAIYINWADRIFNGFEGPFISLNDGKPPLFIWMIGLWSRILPVSLFLSARFASVFIFLCFIIFSLFIFKKYYTLKQGFIFVTLLASSPFIFFHSRMALMDSTLAVFLTTALIFWLTPKIKYNYIFAGIFFGLSYWTKTPAMFLIPFPLISAIFFDRNKRKIIHSLICILISLIIIYSLKISVFFPHLFARSQDFTFTFRDILNGQIDHIFGNFYKFFSWLNIYHSYLYFIAPLLSIVTAFKSKNKLILNFFLATIIFISPFVFLGKIVSSRYYVPVIFFLSIISSYLLTQIKNKKILLTIMTVILVPLIIQNYKILTNYLKFNFPKEDEYQYLKEWSSGIGIKESMEFFQSEAQHNKIKILTEGFFGTTPDGMFVYYADLPQKIKDNFTLVGVGEIGSKEYQNEIKNSSYNKLYYVGNSHRINPVNLNSKIILLKSYPKKDNYSSFQIYQLNYEN